MLERSRRKRILLRLKGISRKVDTLPVQETASNFLFLRIFNYKNGYAVVNYNALQSLKRSEFLVFTYEPINKSK